MMFHWNDILPPSTPPPKPRSAFRSFSNDPSGLGQKGIPLLSLEFFELDSGTGLGFIVFFWSGIVRYQTTKQQKFQTVWFMIYIDLWYASENVLGNIMKYLDQRVDFEHETKKILQSKHLILTNRRRSGNLQADAPKGHHPCPWSFARWWIDFFNSRKWAIMICWSSWKVV